MSAIPIAKYFYHPVQKINRPGCPCILTPYYEKVEILEDERRELKTQYTTMRLVHLSKNLFLKNHLNLDQIHYDLLAHSIELQDSGASNAALCKFSFNCLISEKEGGERTNIVFDFRIPGNNSIKEPVFHFDFVASLYEGKDLSYEVLKRLYLEGKRVANPQNHKHGHEPKYVVEGINHDQYIRHSEQHIVGYLAHPNGAEMLVTRLRTEIRSRYPNAVFAKVYNIGLHLHSTKTCCAPCEYNLIGLMNAEDLFLGNFKQIAQMTNDCLEFRFPVRNRFRLVCTVSGNHQNADHRSIPQFIKKNIQKQIPTFDISIKNDSSSRYIYTTFFPFSYDRRVVPVSRSLQDKTVCISGSNKSAGTQGTKNRVQKIRDEEMNEINEGMMVLTLEKASLISRRKIKLKPFSLPA